MNEQAEQRHPAAPRAGAPRIVFVVNVPWFFVSHRLPLAIGAARAGFDVHVTSEAGRESELIRAAGLTFHALPLRRNPWYRGGDLRVLAGLYSLYRRLRPDIVHHVTIKPVLYGSLASRAANVPATINAISGLGWLFMTHGAVASVRRATLRVGLLSGNAHERVWHIFQNAEDAEEYQSRGIAAARRSVLIRGSGVDLSRFVPHPEPTGIPVVVLPARLLFDKGVGEFVEAARILRARGARARFALVGRLDPENPTAVDEATVEKWTSAGIVEWWGHRDDMEQVLRECAIVCLPSYREGMPKALLEAAASGRPIVTTDVPGCRDVVDHGRQGLLVPAKDAASLAAALESLIQNQELRTEYGAAGRLRAEREFGVDQIVAQTLALYGKVLA